MSTMNIVVESWTLHEVNRNAQIEKKVFSYWSIVRLVNDGSIQSTKKRKTVCIYM